MTYLGRNWFYHQRWSRGLKARGQGHKKTPRPRPRTALPRTDPLEAKGQECSRPRAKNTGARVLQKKTKRSLKVFFRRSPKKKGLQKFFQAIPKTQVFKTNFQAIFKILTIQKIVLSSIQGQDNFRGLEASRPRTSKCVLEDVTSVYHLK